jgi:hypothetical protein
MSTRSSIAIRHGTVIKAVYCHWDGYLGYVGRLLDRHYQASPKINNLIALGDISSLGVAIGEEHCFDQVSDYEDGFARQCTFYTRDRGESTPFTTHLSESEWIDRCSFSSCEYFYLYDTGVWWVSQGGDFTPLHEAIEQEFSMKLHVEEYSE